MHIIKSARKEGKNEVETIFDEVMVDNFLKLNEDHTIKAYENQAG